MAASNWRRSSNSSASRRRASTLPEISTSALARRRSRSGSIIRCMLDLARRPVLPPNKSGSISTATYAIGPASGRKKIARIHSMFRPVLITCAISPAWMAMERMMMISDTGNSEHATRRRGSHCRRDRLALALGDADLALHLAAFRPSDIRQRIAEHMLRTRVDGDLHFAAMEPGRRAVGLLRQEPHIHFLGRRSVDLARLAECFLKPRDRLAHAVRRD